MKRCPPEALLELIKSRRSVRSFSSEPVPDEHIQLMLEAARWAPSAGNLQPWSFVIVKDEVLKRRLAEAALNQSFIAEAPVVVVFCGVPERSARFYGRRGSELYVIQDVAAAVQNYSLMAHSLGYGTCWVGAFHEREVREILNLPSNFRPMAIVPTGKPRRLRGVSRRFSLDRFILRR